MKAAYPVIFTETKECVLVEIPDLEILTEGKDGVDAIAMARDAIGLNGIMKEDMGLPIKEPSGIRSIDEKKGTFSNDGFSYVSLVDVDFEEYRKRVDNRMVRRNVTLPNWLNQRADKAKLNVSKVLQEALMAKLGSK
ncbi:MAG: type II toxin-antitoxin system HicB family antitoxin [Bariatricus sp.]